jgi:hypothetical protein
MSLLGFNAVGRLALGQIGQGGATTTTLIAAAGAFAVTGIAATFNITQAAGAGAYIVTGNAAPWGISLVAPSPSALSPRF